jgi:hypothetical protein
MRFRGLHRNIPAHTRITQLDKQHTHQAVYHFRSARTERVIFRGNIPHKAAYEFCIRKPYGAIVHKVKRVYKLMLVTCIKAYPVTHHCTFIGGILNRPLSVTDKQCIGRHMHIYTAYANTASAPYKHYHVLAFRLPFKHRTTFIYGIPAYAANIQVITSRQR